MGVDVSLGISCLHSACPYPSTGRPALKGRAGAAAHMMITRPRPTKVLRAVFGSPSLPGMYAHYRTEPSRPKPCVTHVRLNSSGMGVTQS